MVLATMAIGVPMAEAAGDARLTQSEPEAATRARQLDQLFSRLQATQAEAEADEIVSEIWKLWLQSGRPQIDALMQHAVAIMAQGLPGLAMPVLDEIVMKAPDWAEGWNRRATALYLLGEHGRSRADIDRVLELEPRHFGALAGLALIHIAKGEHREALAAYRRALAINPFLKERFELIPALEKEVGEKPI